MKSTFFFAVLLAFATQAFAQCTPDNTLQLVGLYPPDSLLSCVEEGEYYDEVIQFKNFSVVSGASIGFPGLTFTVNWVRVDSINNLPPGLSYTCDDPNCYYTTGEVGCVNVTGTTSAPPGDYHLGFFATVEVDLGGGTPFQIQADSALLASNGLAYKLTVIAQGDTCPNDPYIPPVCIPNPNLTEVGFFPPDTVLDCAESGTYYDVVIQFKNFDIIDGGAIGFPGFTFTITSVELNAVTNVPAGLSYACNNPDCFFLGGEVGCVRISGYTNAAPGVYNLGFNATVYVQGLTTPIQADSTLLANAGLGYRLTVIPAGTVCPNTFVAGPLTVQASSPPVACDGDTIPLSASINGGTAPYTFAWSPSPNLSNALLPNPRLYPGHPGTYSVTVSDFNGTTASDAVTVQYTPGPTVTVSNNATICAGASVQLTASGASAYLWTPAAGLSSTTIANPTAAPSATTTYTVEGSDGACSDFATVTVSIDTATPSASFTFIRNNFTVAFVANPANPGGTTYAWDFGDGDNSTQSNPVHQYAQQQIFDVTLIATNTCGLKDTFTAQVDLSVGIAALSHEDAVQVYPNPGNGVYQVEFRNTKAQVQGVEVLTLHGESIFMENTSSYNDRYALDLSNQPKGIYFLKITYPAYAVMKKLVLQ